MQNIQASKKGIKKKKAPLKNKKRIPKESLHYELERGMPLRSYSKKKKVQRRVMQGNYNEFY